VAAGTRRQEYGASNLAAEIQEEGMWRKERLDRNTAEGTLMEGALRQERWRWGIAAGKGRQRHRDRGMAAEIRHASADHPVYQAA
jgi:hypothetical protein